MFNIGNFTLANLYLPSGSDASVKASREQYFYEIIPQLLLNRLDVGCIGGDFNCITSKLDCTNNPGPKLSASLSTMIKALDLQDCFRSKYPESRTYSHYYNTHNLSVEA